MKPLIATLLFALAGVLAAPAHAAKPNAVIQDCTSSTTGELQRTYSKSELRKALAEVKGDIAEYTNCSDAIRNAMRRPVRPAGGGTDRTGGGTGGGGFAGGGSSGGGSGGTADGGTGGAGGSGDGGVGGAAGTGGDGGGAIADTTASAAAPPAPVAHQSGSGEPVKLAGTSITPSIPATLARDGRELPPALIAFLVLFGAGTAGVAVTTLARRVLAHRRG